MPGSRPDRPVVPWVVLPGERQQPHRVLQCCGCLRGVDAAALLQTVSIGKCNVNFHLGVMQLVWCQEQGSYSTG